MKVSRIIKALLAFTLMFVFAVTLSAQDTVTEPQNSVFGNVVIKWLTMIGIPGILAFAFGIWKKGVGIVGRVAGALITLLDGVGNLLVQTIEAKTAIRNEIAKLKAATEDGKLDKAEIEALIAGIELAMKEVDDIPDAVRALKADFVSVVQSFKKK
jgi:hypothetical protein